MNIRQEVNKQKVKDRVKNFLEVALGFTKEQAIQEAQRCIQCKNPLCVQGCPVGIDIPAFIKLIKEGKDKKALAKIKEKNNLPAICGRVCPQEDQCEALCILNKKKIAINPVRDRTPTASDGCLRQPVSNGVNIGALERFAADCGEVPSSQCPVVKKNGVGNRELETGNSRLIKVAVVGSGPAGLTVAADLAKLGYSVVLFESLHLAGGVLSYGIPEFRLPKKIVQSEVEYIKSLGVDIQTNVLIGKTLTLKDLFAQGFKAIFLGLGAGLPQFLNIPGENAPGVYSANEFLTRINLMKAYKFPENITPIRLGKKIVVVGAGNVAFDCARVAIRLGKEVDLVYRRTEVEMPARLEEIENAKQEGLKFELLTQPKEILLNEKGELRALKCSKMQLGEPDASGRRRPVEIPNSEFEIPVDNIIVAIGQRPNPLVSKSTPELKTNPEGTIWVDKNFMTSIKGVFAGGDIITGADTVISAMGAGKKAAKAIEEYIKMIHDTGYM